MNKLLIILLFFASQLAIGAEDINLFPGEAVSLKVGENVTVTCNDDGSNSKNQCECTADASFAWAYEMYKWGNLIYSSKYNFKTKQAALKACEEKKIKQITCY